MIAQMRATAEVESRMAETAYAAFEAIPGALDAGAIIVCDHASNAIPPDYWTLGLKREAL
jgi:predicted N-formylglutamate amidohydrolase